MNDNETSPKAGFSSFYFPENNRFYKFERLKSSRKIAEVFQKTKPSKAFPILLFAQEHRIESDFPVQAAFVVSKKKFKRAVDRNRIKRLMREAYRLKKGYFYSQLSKQNKYRLVFVYVGKQIHSFHQVEQSFERLLEKLIKLDSGE